MEPKFATVEEALAESIVPCNVLDSGKWLASHEKKIRQMCKAEDII